MAVKEAFHAKKTQEKAALAIGTDSDNESIGYIGDSDDESFGLAL